MGEDRTTRRKFLAGATVSVAAIQIPGINTFQQETETGDTTATTQTIETIETSQEQQEAIQWGQFQADAANTGSVPNRSGPTNGVTEQWQFSTDAPVRSSPAIGHGSVFFGSNCGHTFSLAVDTGEEQWRAATGMVDTGVALHGNRVFVAAKPDPENQQTTVQRTSQSGQPNHLRSVFVGNGVEVWNIDIGGQGVSSPTIIDGILYVSGDNVYGINVSSGATVWQNYPFPANYVPDNWDYQDARMIAGSTPGVTQTGAFVSAQLRHYDNQTGTAGALQPKTGENRSGLSRRYSRHAITIDRGTAISGEGDLTVARHATQAAKQWEFRTGPLGASPAVANGTVYAGSADQKLYALNLGNGQLEWLFPADGSIRTAPVVTDDTVYFGTDNGTVFAVNTESGQPRWRFNTQGPVRSDPAVANGTVYVGTDNGRLYALVED